MADASRLLAFPLMASLALSALTSSPRVAAQAPVSSFHWPEGYRAAVSLSFDDARESQLDVGAPVLAETRTKVTFYLTAGNLGNRADDWKKAAAAGHELGNHSMVHPCSGNFGWSRTHALEDMSLDRMRQELTEANRAIEAATGVRPVTFAYPCGQTFVGRGRGVQSYVPLISELFLSGRLWLSEAPNDPGYADLAQLTGYPMDDVEFDELEPVIRNAVDRGQWLVLAGHDIGSTPGKQVTRVSMLRALTRYLQQRDRLVWVDTVGAVAAHVQRSRPHVP
jgi:peptidoglycan/xylan/chitin deacetylase (PgdA/CDA1 family)